MFSGQPVLYWVSRHMSTWSTVAFNLAVLVNVIVATFYPFEGAKGIGIRFFQLFTFDLINCASFKGKKQT